MRNSLTFAAALLAWIVPIVVSGLEPTAAPAAALHAAMVKNAAHARNLLEQADYKSLAQSAGSTKLLTELLHAKSNKPAWQTAVEQLIAAIGALQTAARAEDQAKCKSALADVEKQLESASLAREPMGQPQPLPTPPGIRSLMATMDGINADAKIAVMTGNIEAAKKQAFVLAELAKLVSNSRSGDKWSSLSADFTKATLAAATTAETDSKAVRQLLRGISQQCEACHESSRAR